jgi:hypothetical protein
MIELGKTIIFIGLSLILVGVLIIIFGKFNHLGRLPGDILLKKGSFKLYFPITSCILLSLIFSLIMFLISKK